MDKELAYYVTLFRIEDHTTWRGHFSADAAAFDRERMKWQNPPKITAKKVFRFDRLTGEVDIKEF